MDRLTDWPSVSDVRSPSWVSIAGDWIDPIGTLRDLPDLDEECQEQEQKTVE